MIQRKILVILLAGLFLISSMTPAGVPKADAAITVDQIQNTLSTLQKLSRLNQDQVIQAIGIAQSVVSQAGLENSWMDTAEIINLKAKGLTRSDVNAALGAIKTTVSNTTRWSELTSPDPGVQLNAAADLANQVIASFSDDFKNNLKARGIQITDLIVAALDLVNVQVESWSSLPRDAINSIFDNYPANPPISRETASKYGLNWTNVQQILDSLTYEQRSQLEAILMALGNWMAVGFQVPAPVWAYNQIAGNQTRYTLQIPISKQLTDGSKIIIEFPAAYSGLLGSVAKTPAGEAPYNDDINGPMGGTVTFSDTITVSGTTVTLTI
ncbi:MAG: hypothetical protein M1543_00085, partial [Firmicutes bacterium]|nr:hypothetical protein [Bacillota bacterium]